MINARQIDLKRATILAAALGLLVGVVLAAPADNEPASTTASGQVTAVDVKANTLGVKVEQEGKDPQDMTFIVDAETKILENGNPVTLPDLRAGDHVMIGYRNTGGKALALTIGVQKGPRRTETA
jgi:hypothetical protein